MAFQQSERDYRRFILQRAFTRGRFPRPTLAREVEPLVASATNADEFRDTINKLATQKHDHIKAVEERQTNGSITAFAGETKLPPAYAGWLMKEYGSMPFLHFRERKQPIGRDEAEALLRLKVRGGGPERLALVQQTVRGLLGVNIDAF